MSDFLADNNLCGQSLLSIVSRGNTILAQLFRLKDNLPQVFKVDPHKQDLSNAKYSELIIDLRYFSQVDEFERKVEQSPIFQELDNELRESYTEILTEFYNLFESIYKYVVGLNKFVGDVQDGLFIQCSLESILWNVEGRQLLVESVYLYGTMLLLIDRYIDGPIRERMLTSFYRYAGAQAGAGDTNLDDVCKLLRSTNRKSVLYPADYFGRVELNPTLISMLLGRLRSDDIYNQLSSYPLPEHRSTALGSQASILVIVLAFAPTVLQTDIPTMREICDKFFHDNWILPIYMGTNLNLLEFWKDFRAAKAGMEICKVPLPSRIGADKIPKLIDELSKVLKEGYLTEDNILERVGKVIGLLREANVVLRWTMLHCGPLESESTVTKKSKQFRDAVLLQLKYDPEIVLSLLLHVAQLELRVKELYKKLLQEKQSKWLTLKFEAKDRIVELAEVFSGTKPLSRIEKNDTLSQWLQTKAAVIESLEFERLNYSGRKIIELIRAFDDMLEYHNLESLVQVREWVADTTACLHKMLRTGAVNEDTLVTLQIISDLGYAWGKGIDNYTPQMQSLIKKDPTAVSKLRAVFLKLASAMDMPLLRLSTAKFVGSSKDLLTVSNYYSGELVAYVQKVLQIIPESVFSLLHQIIQLQTHSIQELPTRLDKDKVKDFAQLEYRQQVSRLTHDMSVLTEGILMMQTTLVGIIQIDPKELLENGIRKELVRQLMLTLSGPFNGGNNSTYLIAKLQQISQRIQGIRRSFEYIGDYVNTNGLQIYQEELGRTLNFAIEQEINQWKKVKILPFSSIYQSKQVPISLPRLGQDDGSGATTFLGKLVNELLSLTEPKSTVYLPSTNSWYESKAPNNTVIIPDNFKLLENAVDIIGMTGIDKILCFLIAKELEKLVATGQSEINAGIDTFANLHSSLQPPSKTQPMAKYTSNSVISRTQAHLSILRVGQLQLLRKRIQYQLQVSSSLNAKQLKSSVQGVNRLASELLLHQTEELVEEIAIETLGYSEPLGIYEPLTKIYLTLKPIQFFPLYLSLITIQNAIRKLQYVKTLGTIKCKRVSDGVDGLPFTIGIITILTQCHPSQTILYLSYVCQYMNSLIVDMSKLTNPKKDSGDELGSIYYFLKLFLRYKASEEMERFVKMLVPSFDTLPTLVNLLSS